MPDADDINDQIAENALAPKKTQVGNQSIEEYGIDELIKASNHVAAKNAGSVVGFGIRYAKMIPPGGG
jgi:hypothetical protein